MATKQTKGKKGASAAKNNSAASDRLISGLTYIFTFLALVFLIMAYIKYY